jgi:hypothetical protein
MAPTTIPEVTRAPFNRYGSASKMAINASNIVRRCFQKRYSFRYPIQIDVKGASKYD